MLFKQKGKNKKEKNILSTQKKGKRLLFLLLKNTEQY